MPYEDWLPKSAPGFLQRFYGSQFFGAIGLCLDAFTEAAKQGVKARFPGYSPPDGLTAIGYERSLPRITVLGYEVDTTYGARLLAAWDDLAFARTVTGLRKILLQIGALAPAPWTTNIYEQGEWNPWYPWSWGYVLVQQPHPWVSDGNWGDPGVGGDAGTWGSSATAAQVGNLRAVLHPWVPANERLFVVVVTNEEVWGEPGEWGDPGVWGGAAVKWPM